MVSPGDFPDRRPLGSASPRATVPPAAHDPADPADQPVQFSLWALLFAVTAAGVVLGLLKALGVFGALVAFLAAAVLTLVLYPRYRPRAIQQQEALFDFVWGLIMPLICLAVDPIVFKYGDINLPPRPDQPWELTDLFTRAGFYSYSFAAYVFFGWQMALLMAALVLGRPSVRWAAFLSGTFNIGYMTAVLIGTLALLPSLLGLYVGVGLLGFTPLFTAFAFHRRMQRADAVAWGGSPAERTDLWLIAGIVTTIVLPLCTGAALTMIAVMVGGI
jgi:hypothetical protein